MPRRDLAHGLLGGLEEIEERVAGLQHISAGITTRLSHALNASQHLELGTTGSNYAHAAQPAFEDTVKAEFVDLSDFGLGSVPVRPTAEKPESQTAARPSTRQSGKEGKDQAPVTDDATLRAVRTLGTTKESARVEPCTKILHRALVHGNTEARSTACLPRSVQVLVSLVAERLPVFEYTRILNASKTLSAREADREKLLVLRLRLAGVQALGLIFGKSGVALARAQSDGAPMALISLFQSTYSTFTNIDEKSTPCAALAPTTLTQILRVLCVIAKGNRSAAICVCENDAFMASVLALCNSNLNQSEVEHEQARDLQSSAVQMCQALADIQQCRPRLIAHGFVEAMSSMCMSELNSAWNPDLECQGRSVEALSSLLQDVVSGRAYRFGQEMVRGQRLGKCKQVLPAEDYDQASALNACFDCTLAILRQCSNAWSDSGEKSINVLVVGSVLSKACMCMRIGIERLASGQKQVQLARLRFPRETMLAFVADEIKVFINALEEDIKECEESGWPCKRRMLKDLSSCRAAAVQGQAQAEQTHEVLLDAPNTRLPNGHLAVVGPRTSDSGSSKLRSVAQLGKLLDASHHKGGRCDCTHKQTTCDIVRELAALDLRRWATMPGGVDCILKQDGLMAVLVACLRRKPSMSSQAESVWNASASLVLQLLSNRAGASKFLHARGDEVLLKLWRDQGSEVQGEVFEMFQQLMTHSKAGLQVAQTKDIRQLMMTGVRAAQHPDKALLLVFRVVEANANTMPQELWGWQDQELVDIAETSRVCTERGVGHVLERAATFFGQLMSSQAFIDQHHAALQTFVAKLCAGLHVCQSQEETACLARALACHSAAAGPSKAVLLAVRDSVCSSVESVAKTSSDVRIMDYALVLLRNMGKSSDDCLSLRALHLVRIIKESFFAGTHIQSQLRIPKDKTLPWRALRLLSDLVAGHAEARAAALRVGADQLLLGFLCSVPRHTDLITPDDSMFSDLRTRDLVASAFITAIMCRFSRAEQSQEKSMFDSGHAVRDCSKLPSKPETFALHSKHANKEGMAEDSSPVSRRAISIQSKDVDSLVLLVERFSSIDARQNGKAASITDQQRIEAAQELLQKTDNHQVWVAAVTRSNKVVGALCEAAEAYMDRRLSSERSNQRLLGLALLLLRRVISECAARCATCAPAASLKQTTVCQVCLAFTGAIKRVPLKRVLQILVMVDDAQITAAARSFLLALSSSDNGAERLLKDGVVHILGELIRADGAWIRPDARFGIAAADYLAVFHSMCQTAVGSKVAQQISLDSVVIQALIKFLERTQDGVVCRCASEVLLRSVSSSSGGNMRCFLPAMAPLVAVARNGTQPELCTTAVKTLTLMLGDVGCNQAFVSLEGCGAVLLAMDHAVKEYLEIANRDSHSNGKGGLSQTAHDEQDPNIGIRTSSGRLRADEETTAVTMRLAALIHHCGDCLVHAGKYEASRAGLRVVSGGSRLVHVLSGLSKTLVVDGALLSEPNPAMLLTALHALLVLVQDTVARQAFTAPLDLDLFFLSNVLSEKQRVEEMVLCDTVRKALQRTLASCARDLGEMTNTMKAVKAGRNRLHERLVGKPCNPQDLENNVLTSKRTKEEKAQGKGKQAEEAVFRAKQALAAMNSQQQQQLEALVGTLTVLRVLSHLPAARQYMMNVDNEGCADNMGAHMVSILASALNELHLQPPDLLGAVSHHSLVADVDFPQHDYVHAGPTPQLPAGVSTCLRLALAVWTCLTAIQNMLRESDFVVELLAQQEMTPALRWAMACSHSQIAAAAALVVQRVAGSPRGRSSMLQQGFLGSILLKCTPAEPAHVRAAATSALHSLMRGQEVYHHQGVVHRLLTTDALLCLGDAGLTSSMEKLLYIQSCISALPIDQLLQQLQAEHASQRKIFQVLSQDKFESMLSASKSIAQMQLALASLPRLQSSSAATTRMPLSRSSDQTSNSTSAIHALCERVSWFLSLSDMIEVLAQEDVNLETAYQNALKLHHNIGQESERRKKHEQQTQRLLDVFEVSPSNSSLIEKERPLIEDERAKLLDVSRIKDLVWKLVQQLAQLRSALKPLVRASASLSYTKAARSALQRLQDALEAFPGPTHASGADSTAKTTMTRQLEMDIVRHMHILAGLHLSPAAITHDVLDVLLLMVNVEKTHAAAACVQGLFDKVMKHVTTASDSASEVSCCKALKLLACLLDDAACCQIFKDDGYVGTLHAVTESAGWHDDVGSERHLLVLECLSKVNVLSSADCSVGLARRLAQRIILEGIAEKQRVMAAEQLLKLASSSRLGQRRLLEAEVPRLLVDWLKTSHHYRQHVSPQLITSTCDVISAMLRATAQEDEADPHTRAAPLRSHEKVVSGKRSIVLRGSAKRAPLQQHKWTPPEPAYSNLLDAQAYVTDAAEHKDESLEIEESVAHSLDDPRTHYLSLQGAQMNELPAAGSTSPGGVEQQQQGIAVASSSQESHGGDTKAEARPANRCADSHAPTAHEPTHSSSSSHDDAPEPQDAPEFTTPDHRNQLLTHDQSTHEEETMRMQQHNLRQIAATRRSEEFAVHAAAKPSEQDRQMEAVGIDDPHCGSPPHPRDVSAPAKTADAVQTENEGTTCGRCCVNAWAGFHHVRCKMNTANIGAARRRQDASLMATVHARCESLRLADHEEARDRLQAGIVGLRSVLEVARNWLRHLPSPQQHSVYSAIRSSDGDFAELIRGLAACGIQSAFRAHRARSMCRQLGALQQVLKQSASIFDALPVALQQQVRLLLSGSHGVDVEHDQDAKERERDAACVLHLDSSRPTQEGDLSDLELDMVRNILSNGSILLKHPDIGRNLRALLILDEKDNVTSSPSLAKNLCRSLVLHSTATMIQKVFRGHIHRSRRFKMVSVSTDRGALCARQLDRTLDNSWLSVQAVSSQAGAATAAASPDLPSAVLVPKDEASVDNMAAAGLAGMVHMLQLTLLKWKSLDSPLRGALIGSIAMGQGPLVTIVRNVSAVSLQMAVRCHFARRTYRSKRLLSLSRDLTVPATAMNADRLHLQADTAWPHLISPSMPRSKELHLHSSGLGFAGEQRLSCSVSVFVRQLQALLEQRHDSQHARRLWNAFRQNGGPLENNIRQLSALSVQAVVRGHQTRRRLGKFRQAVGQLASLVRCDAVPGPSGPLSLSLSQSIALGRQLFAYQEDRLGGTHSFFSAVCAGQGAVSEVLRHVSTVTIQCAWRARQARAMWLRYASHALQQEQSRELPRLPSKSQASPGKPKALQRSPRAQATYKWKTLAPETAANDDLSNTLIPVALPEARGIAHEASSEGGLIKDERQVGMVIEGADASQACDASDTEYSSCSEHRNSEDEGDLLDSGEGQEDWNFTVEEYESIDAQDVQHLDAQDAGAHHEQIAELLSARPEDPPRMADGCMTMVMQGDEPGLVDSREQESEASFAQEKAHGSGLPTRLIRLHEHALRATAAADEVETLSLDAARADTTEMGEFIENTASSVEVNAPADIVEDNSAVARPDVTGIQMSAQTELFARATPAQPARAAQMAVPETRLCREAPSSRLQAEPSKGSTQGNSAADEIFKSSCLRDHRVRLLPVLLECLRGTSTWRRNMHDLLAHLHNLGLPEQLLPTSGLYMMLMHNLHFMEADCRAEAARCLQQLCTSHRPTTRRVVNSGAVADCCAILTAPHARRAHSSAACLLETLAKHSARSLITWVQTQSHFERLELILMQLLHVACSALQDKAQEADQVPQVVLAVLSSVFHLVLCQRAQTGKAMIARGAIETLLRLLQHEWVTEHSSQHAKSFELACAILDMLLAHATGRRQFRSVGGIEVLVSKLCAPMMDSAFAIVKTLRRLLQLSDQPLADAQKMLQLSGDAALVRCLLRVEASKDVHATTAVLALLAELLRMTPVRDEFLLREPSLVSTVVRITSAPPPLGRHASLLCLQLLASGVLPSAQGVELMLKADACAAYNNIAACAPSKLHRCLALSGLTRLQSTVDINQFETREVETRLEALLLGCAAPAAAMKFAPGAVAAARACEGNFEALEAEAPRTGTERLECVAALACLAGSFHLRPRLLALPAIPIIASVLNEFASAKQGQSSFPTAGICERRSVAEQIRAECASLIYLLSDPDAETCCMAQMLEADVLDVLLRAIECDRAGASLTSGLEPKGPSLLVCLAALFRLLSHFRFRRAIMQQPSCDLVRRLCQLVPLIRSPNVQVAVFAAMIMGKLMSDGFQQNQAACRSLILQSQLIPTLTAALFQSFARISDRNASSVVNEQALLRRSSLLHVLAAIAHLGVVRQALIQPKCLSVLFWAMIHSQVVECKLNEGQDRSMQMSIAACEFEARGARDSPGPGLLYGPFSKNWYGMSDHHARSLRAGGSMQVPPLLSTSADAVYMLFKIVSTSSLEFAFAVRKHGGSRTMDRMISAVLAAAHTPLDPSSGHTMLVFHTLLRLLAFNEACLCAESPHSLPSHTLASGELADALHAVTVEGELALQEVASDIRAASVVRTGAGWAGKEEDGSKRWVNHAPATHRLLTLHAATSAIRYLCIAQRRSLNLKRNIMLSGLRCRPNFVHLVVGTLKALSDVRSGVQHVQDEYLASLNLDGPSAFLFQHTDMASLAPPHAWNLKGDSARAEQLKQMRPDDIQQVFANLIVSIREHCLAILMHVTWTCMPQPSPQPLARQSLENALEFQDTHAVWSLDISLTRAMAQGVIKPSQLARSVMVRALIGAGANEVLLSALKRVELLVAKSGSSLAVLPTAEVRACTSAVNSLIGIGLLEACRGGDSWFCSSCAALLPAMARLLVIEAPGPPLVARDSQQPANDYEVIEDVLVGWSADVPSLQNSVACLLAVLFFYQSEAAGGIYQWLLERVQQALASATRPLGLPVLPVDQNLAQGHLMNLLAACVNFIGRAAPGSESCIMVVRFLVSVCGSKSGQQAAVYALGLTGRAILQASWRQVDKVLSSLAKSLPLPADGTEALARDAVALHRDLLGDVLSACKWQEGAFNQSHADLQQGHLQCAASNLSGADAQDLEARLVLQYARSLLLSHGKTICLSRIPRQLLDPARMKQHDEAVLQAAKDLCAAGLGKLSRFAKGSLVQFQFAGMSISEWTPNRERILARCLADLLSKHEQQIRDSSRPAPTWCSLYQDDPHINTLLEDCYLELKLQSHVQPCNVHISKVEEKRDVGLQVSINVDVSRTLGQATGEQIQQAKQKAAQRSCDLATLAENLVSEGRLQIQLDRKGWDRQGQIKISVVHNNHDGRLYFTKAGLHHDAWPAPRRVNSKQKRDHRVGGDTGPTRKQQVALHLYGVSSVAAYQRSLTLTPVHQQDFPLPWSHVSSTWDPDHQTWQSPGSEPNWTEKDH